MLDGKMVDSPNPPSTSRARTRYEARRQEIVDIAARVFAERGYHATSIDHLVEATGLQRGGLYHYIGTKEELLFQIHERFIDPLLTSAREIESRGDPPADTLRALARALMGDIATYHDQVTVFLHEWKTLGTSKDGERVKKVMAARKQFEDVIDRALKRGIEQGVFVVEDPRLAVLAFLGMINYAYQWYSSRGPYSSDLIADSFCNYFLYGISRDRGHG